MFYIKHPLAFLIAAVFVLPLAAQSSNPKIRVDSSRKDIRDNYGNVVGQSFEWRMEGNFGGNKDRLNKEQLKSYKVSFFSNSIGLTSKEAESFWPVYNEYSDKLESLKKEQRKVLNQLSNFEAMSNEKDVKVLLDAYVTSYVQESTLFQEYYKKFCAILPPSKVVRLYLAEEQFRLWLIDLLRGGR